MRTSAIIVLQILSITLLGACDRAKSSASRPATRPGSIPTQAEVLGEWKVVGDGGASSLLLNEDGTFSNTPASPIDVASKGTWALDGADLTTTVTDAKGKTRAYKASLKWDNDGVMLMSTRDFPHPLRMTRGEWPKEVYENLKK